MISEGQRGCVQVTKLPPPARLVAAWAARALGTAALSRAAPPQRSTRPAPAPARPVQLAAQQEAYYT